MHKLKFPFLTAVLALACALPSAAQKAGRDKADAPRASATALADSQWEFLKTAGQDKEKDVLELVLPQLEDWLARNPEDHNSAEAQLLKADLHYKLGDYKFALVDLLQFFQAYPQDLLLTDAQKLFTEIIVKKGDKKTRPLLEEAATAPETAAADLNISSMLEKFSARAGEAYYEPLTAEFRAFFNRFPAYSGNDSLRLALADLHREKGKYLAAELGYEEMIQMYPSSPLLARAKSTLAGVLADNLKSYDKAIDVYGGIAASFPGTDEALAAYNRLPALAERQKKFDLAVQTYEKIIELYPDRSEAYNSYKEEARVLRKELKNFPEAVSVLNRLADKYKGDSGKSVEALLLAAEIYRKDIKDTEGEVKMYDRIAAEYENDPQAPRSLYAAGEIYEKAKDKDKAGEYYRKITEKYGADPLAKKARNRLEALAKP